MWKATTIAVFLYVTFVTGVAPRIPSLDDTVPIIWYTQIGAWHLIHDSISGTSHLYHNAAVDGARSGQARPDLKYNRQISSITHLSVDLTLGRASAAGVLLKDKKLAYGIYLEKGNNLDSVRIIRRFEKQQSSITAFAVTTAGTQCLDVTLSVDSLRVKVGHTTQSIRKPTDLPGEVIVALSCERGETRIWRIRIEASSVNINESFDDATVINLGMERMFKTGRKNVK